MFTQEVSPHTRLTLAVMHKCNAALLTHLNVLCSHFKADGGRPVASVGGAPGPDPVDYLMNVSRSLTRGVSRRRCGLKLGVIDCI